MVFQLTTRVKDHNGIANTKSFQLSSGLIYHFEIKSGTDEQIDAADIASLKFFVKNISNETIENIELQTLLDNENITVLKSGAHFGTLSPGETKAIDSAFVLKVAGTITDQYSFMLSNQLSNAEKSWHSDICLTAAALQLNVVEIVVVDGNNGILEAGETADLQIEFQNLGHAAGNDLDIRFVSNSDYLIINTPSQHTGHLAVGGTVILSYNVTTRGWTPAGFTTASEFELTSQSENIGSLSVPITIGRTPVFLLNLEEQSYSADLFRSIFDSLKLQYDISNAFPLDLNDYHSVFVFLGDKFNNYELSGFEGGWLSNYLENGGNVYMEGMRTWLEDEPTSAHNKFSFDVISDGSYFPFDTVFGVEGRLTEGIAMAYGGSIPFNNHYLLPTGTAFPFLLTSPSDTACAVANSTSNYKTIGSSVLFGKMEDPNSSSATTEYAKAILEFFEVEIQVVDVPEYNGTENTMKFEAYPNPFRNRLTMQFFVEDETKASFDIYDINGRIILHQKLPIVYTKRAVEIHWDGRDKDGKQQSPGIYIIRYNSGEQSVTKKVVMR